MKRSATKSLKPSNCKRRLRGCSQIDIEGFTCWVGSESDVENRSNIHYSNKSKERAQRRNELIDLATLAHYDDDDKPILSAVELTKFQSIIKSTFCALPKRPLKFGDKSVPMSAVMSQTPTKGLKMVPFEGVEVRLKDPSERNTKELIESFKRKSLGGSVPPAQRRKSFITDGKGRNSLVTAGFDIGFPYPKDVEPGDWWKQFPSVQNNTARMQQLFGWCIQYLLDNDTLDRAQITLCNSILDKLSTKDINTSWYRRQEQVEDAVEYNPLLIELNKFRQEQHQRLSSLQILLDSLAEQATRLSCGQTDAANLPSCLAESDAKAIVDNEQMLSNINGIMTEMSEFTTRWNAQINQLNYDARIIEQFTEVANEFCPLALDYAKLLLLSRSNSPQQPCNSSLFAGTDIFGLFRLYCDSFQTSSLVKDVYQTIEL